MQATGLSGGRAPLVRVKGDQELVPGRYLNKFVQLCGGILDPRWGVGNYDVSVEGVGTTK